MTAKSNTLQRLEWNTCGDSRDEIVQRVLSGAAHACNDNESDIFFDSETLWRELRHRDPARRLAALGVVDSCAELAELRADKYELTYFDARYSILECDLLDRDLSDPDPAISEAAHRVFESVSALQALRDDVFGSDEHRAWMHEMRMELLKRLHAARNESAAPGGGHV